MSKKESTSVTVTFEITSCKNCPYCSTERAYTADSFETAYRWICGKENKTIAGYVETFDKDPKIPEWCPLRV